MSLQHCGSDPAHPGWSRTYAYNEESQIEQSKHSNRLSSTTIGTRTEGYRYDGLGGVHGNITAMPHLTLMQWDHYDQLHASARQAVVEGTPETTWYVYDAGGQRARKTTERANGARKDERLYLAGFEIFREYDAGGVTVVIERESLHVMDDRQRIALVETRTQGNDGSPARLVRFQFGNYISSASLELDERAAIISYEEYCPFGNTSYQAVRRQTDAPKRYRFGAMERDEESGMEYHSARYYLPWLGRWLSSDPIGLSGGINLYSYSRNSPIMLTDSGGSSPDDVTLMYGASIRKADKRKTYYDEEAGTLYVDATDYFTPISARLKKHGDEPTEFEHQLINDFNEDKIRSYQLITDDQGKIYGYRVKGAKVGEGRYVGEGGGEYYSAIFNRDGTFIEGRMFSPNNGTAISVMSPIDFIAGGIVAGATTKLLLSIAPKATTVGIGWIVGTNTGEAIWGETAGINPIRLVGGDTSVGKKLSSGDRVMSLVTATTFALAVPRGGFLEPPSPFLTLSDEEMMAARGAGPRRLDVAEAQARDAAVAELSQSHSPRLAGTAFHDAMGAARQGVDLSRHGGAFQLELKTHYTTSLSESQISSASAQSFGYSRNYQLTTGLVPIRQVRHYLINPRVHGRGIRIDSH